MTPKTLQTVIPEYKEKEAPKGCPKASQCVFVWGYEMCMCMGSLSDRPILLHMRMLVFQLFFTQCFLFFGIITLKEDKNLVC